MWVIRLAGDEKLLEASSQRYSQVGLNIEPRDDRYFLHSVRLQGLSSLRDVYEAGEELIAFINYSSKLINRRQDPVKSDGYGEIVGERSFECKFYSASGPGRIPLRCTTITNDLPEEDFLDLYLNSERAKFVLSEFNRERLDWFSLFNIYEAVLNDAAVVGEFPSDKLAIEGLSNLLDNKQFLGTANWHRHSKYGRTNRRSSRAPKQPMQLVEGEEFIRKLVIAWLRFKVRKA